MDQDNEVHEQKTNLNDPTRGGKKGRVIIRNLVFDIQEHHLKKLLGQFGEILDVNIPINPSSNKSKGFAFVEFKNKNHAANAIQSLNGTKFKGREIILDSAVGKDRFVQHKNQEQTNGEKIETEEPKVIIEEEAPPVMKKHEIKALKKQEQNEKLQQQIKSQKTKQKQKQDEDLSQTVFVRNLPLEIEEENLKEFFSKFGDVQFAKLVVNKETGDQKGTAFVKFKSSEVAQDVLKKSDELEKLHQNERFNKKSHLSKDELELLSGEFDFDGRRVFVFSAMKKNDAVELQKEHDKEKTKPTKDIRKVKHLKQLIAYDPNGKRNLKLCLMGIFEAEEGMHPKEAQRREEHVKAKLEKLKNPNFYVSDNRVALKNLPKTQTLKENLENIVEQSLNHSNIKVDSRKRVLQRVWISRDQSIMKINPEEAPMTGLAFLEFAEKEHALAFMKYVTECRDELLKQLHNKLPIVEFAIEDVRKIRRIELRRQQQKEQQIQRQKEKLEKNGGRETRTERKNKINEINKLAIENILKQEDCHTEQNVQKIESLWKELKSRGMKQRIKKKIENKININLTMPQKEQTQNIQQNTKKQQKQSKLESKQQKIQFKQLDEQKSEKEEKISEKDKKVLHNRFDEVINDIKQKVLNKKKIRSLNQETDDVDELAEQRMRQLQKKVKWYN